MSYYKNILVAFDGSSDSTHALEVAEAFAKDFKANLTVAYVYDMPLEKIVYPNTASAGDPNLFPSQMYYRPGSVTENPSAASPESHEPMIIEDETPEEMLADAKNKISKEIDVKYEKLSGKPADELNDYAMGNEIDLIVIGNRGMSGIKKFVMGSVSQKVTNHAECSVLVVK